MAMAVLLAALLGLGGAGDPDAMPDLLGGPLELSDTSGLLDLGSADAEPTEPSAVGGLLDAVSGDLLDPLEPVVDPVLESDVVHGLDPLADPVLAATQPTLSSATAPVTSVAEPVADVLDPVLEATAPVLDGVGGSTESLVAVVDGVAAPALGVAEDPLHVAGATVEPLAGGVEDALEPADHVVAALASPAVHALAPALPVDSLLDGDPAPDSASSRAATAPPVPTGDGSWISPQDDPAAAPVKVSAIVAASALLPASGLAVVALRPDVAVQMATRLARSRILPWLASLPAIGMFSRIEDDALAKHPVRRQILDLLEADPGSSIMQIRERIGIAWGTAVYHLDKLERARLVVSQRDGRLHRYWTEADPEARSRDAACLMKADPAMRLAQAIACRPGIHQRALCEDVGLKPPVASKWLGRLTEQGLICAVPDGRRRVYVPAPQLNAYVAGAA